MRPNTHATGKTLKMRSQNGMIGIGTGRRRYFENVKSGVWSTGTASKNFQRTTPMSPPTNPPNDDRPSHSMKIDQGRLSSSAG